MLVMVDELDQSSGFGTRDTSGAADTERMTTDV
jgi:hypothetical protein